MSMAFFIWACRRYRHFWSVYVFSTPSGFTQCAALCFNPSRGLYLTATGCPPFNFKCFVLYFLAPIVVEILEEIATKSGFKLLIFI